MAVEGHSLARPECGNFGLCAPEPWRGPLEHALVGLERAERLKRLRALHAPLVAPYDFVLCSVPALWCVDFLLAFDKPTLAYADLPLLWQVPEDFRPLYLEGFLHLAVSPRHALLVSDPLLREQVQLQLAVAPAVLRRTAPHVLPLEPAPRGAEVLVSRVGTSGGIFECLLRPLQHTFVHFQDLFDPHRSLVEKRLSPLLSLFLSFSYLLPWWRRSLVEKRADKLDFTSFRRFKAVVMLPSEERGLQMTRRKRQLVNKRLGVAGEGTTARCTSSTSTSRCTCPSSCPPRPAALAAATRDAQGSDD